jgi:hypothetical protein
MPSISNFTVGWAERPSVRRREQNIFHKQKGSFLMKLFMKFNYYSAGMFLLSLIFSSLSFAQEYQIKPGKNIEITFPDADLPPILHTLMTGEKAIPTLTFRLPDDYDSTKTYPLLVYVPGWDGGLKGNMYNAQTIAGTNGWIAATLPLFKKAIDKSEPGGGMIVSMEDNSTIAQCYEIMLGKLFELIPNIECDRSAMVGFSNGAITLAVLLSSHDEFIFNHFKNFCMVDHGMFHLTDLHKKGSRDCRYLILVGDKQDFGRELKIQRSKLLQDEMKLLGVNLSCEIMKDTGHEFYEKQMAIVGKWLRKESATQ